jgi:hypothetical protein
VSCLGCCPASMVVGEEAPRSGISSRSAAAGCTNPHRQQHVEQPQPRAA